MCRNIRTLHNFEPPANHEEIEAAALQYVRKISGFTKPSKANEEAFDAAVHEVAEVSARLLAALTTQRAAQEPRGRGRRRPGPAPPSATPPEAAARSRPGPPPNGATRTTASTSSAP